MSLIVSTMSKVNSSESFFHWVPSLQSVVYYTVGYGIIGMCIAYSIHILYAMNRKIAELEQKLADQKKEISDGFQNMDIQWNEKWDIQSKSMEDRMENRIEQMKQDVIRKYNHIVDTINTEVKNMNKKIENIANEKKNDKTIEMQKKYEMVESRNHLLEARMNVWEGYLSETNEKLKWGILNTNLKIQNHYQSQLRHTEQISILSDKVKRMGDYISDDYVYIGWGSNSNISPILLHRNTNNTETIIKYLRYTSNVVDYTRLHYLALESVDFTLLLRNPNFNDRYITYLDEKNTFNFRNKTDNYNYTFDEINYIKTMLLYFKSHKIEVINMDNECKKLFL